MPEPRTSHNINNVEIIEQGGDECKLRFNWITFDYRYKIVDTYFGTSFYTLDISGENLRLHQEEDGDPEKQLCPPRH